MDIKQIFTNEFPYGLQLEYYKLQAPSPPFDNI